jgi:hypothetical protein
MNKKKKFSYDNRVVTKPWGNEYVVYRNSKKLSVTLLNIDYNKKNVTCDWINKKLNCDIKQVDSFNYEF